MKVCQPLAGWLYVESEIREPLLQSCGDSRCLIRRSRHGRVDQEKAVAFLLRKKTQEIFLRHYQLALKNAVRQSANQTQPHWPLALLQDQIVTELEVQHIS